MCNYISQEKIKQRFQYADGHLYYIKSCGSALAGNRFGHIVGGYIQGRLDYVNYYEHVLIWVLLTGKLPAHSIDHINGNKRDNRIENLRDITLQQNCSHRTNGHVNSTTGFVGVTAGPVNFRSQICVSGKNVELGRYDTKLEAALARLSFECACSKVPVTQETLIYRQIRSFWPELNIQGKIL